MLHKTFVALLAVASIGLVSPTLWRVAAKVELRLSPGDLRRSLSAHAARRITAGRT